MTEHSGLKARARARTTGIVTSGAVAAAVAAMLGATPVVAQETASSLEEVVVTARFRQEDLQTTPLWVSKICRSATCRRCRAMASPICA